MRQMITFAVICAITGLSLPSVGWEQTSVWAQGQSSSSPPQPASPTTTVPIGRIAVINTNAFYSEQEGIYQLVQQIKRVEDMFKDRRAELEALDQRVASLQRELETQGPNLTPQARADKQDALEQLQREFQRKKEDFDRDSQRALRDAIAPIQERVRVFLDTYAKTRGITIVLEVANLAQAGGLAYVDPATDITRDFIAEYNKANPVATPPPAPGSIQGATTSQPKSNPPAKKP